MASSSSSSSSCSWVYDVFPSFSGEDVRVTFLSHFLKELDRKLIISFKDNEIERSQSLAPELKQAIRTSRIAVVVFSEKYPSSSWCLDELMEIVNCKKESGQLVIPIFYGLDPSHVRKQTGKFGEAFENTCQRKTEDETKLWRQSLTDVANILGYHSHNWHSEANMIETIANDVLSKLNITPPKNFEEFVGMEDHIGKMSVLLDLESEEVRMVGIWGTSGIGKTTIARALYSRLSHHFQGTIFIDRAFVSKSTEIYKNFNLDDYNKKLHLVRSFLSEVLDKKDIRIDCLSAMEGRLKNKKVLISIDDLDDQMVLDTLAGQTHWFGSGSRIIVVTKDKHFLRAHGIDYIYNVSFLSKELALEMLCISAFKKNTPPEDMRELASKVAFLAGNLPLGLKVLGSSLRGRNKDDWMDMLPRLQNSLDGNIEKILRVSYDGLNNRKDKAIFRHIACLFNGEKLNDIKLFLADSDLDVNIGLKNLLDKSLIHVTPYDIVEMHCLLEDMGKEIVRAQSNEPGQREFLVDSSDICDLFEDNTVLGIALNMDGIDELHIHENVFKRMRNLFFLKLYTENPNKKKQVRWHLPEGFDYFPSKLRLLRFDGYPMKHLPSNFHPENLVKLQMEGSKLEKLWDGVHVLKGLEEINLLGSKNLKEIPDLSMATNLKKLNLKDCSNLVELPSSFQYLNKLENLIMSGCTNLETLPVGINLQSLQMLKLEKCSKLKSFPDISTNISVLFLSETLIEELPSNLRLENLVFLEIMTMKSEQFWEKVQGNEVPWWIEKFSKLEYLTMEKCNNLVFVSINIYKLQLLVDFSDCKGLTEASWKGSQSDVAMALENVHSRFGEVSYRWGFRFKFLKLDAEAILNNRSIIFTSMELSGEEVPSYFTHQTTGNSLISIPLHQTSLTQPFLRLRVCALGFFNSKPDPIYKKVQIHIRCRFKSKFGNSFDSLGQLYHFFTNENDRNLFILDCRIPLSKDNAPLPDQLSYDHVDIQIHAEKVTIDYSYDSNTTFTLRGWGIRLLEDFSSSNGETNADYVKDHLRNIQT